MLHLSAYFLPRQVPSRTIPDIKGRYRNVPSLRIVSPHGRVRCPIKVTWSR